MLRTIKRYEKYKPTGMAWSAFSVIAAVLSPSLPAPLRHCRPLFVIAGFDRQSLPCDSKRCPIKSGMTKEGEMPDQVGHDREGKMPDQVGHDEVVVGHDGCKSEVVSIIIIFAQKFCLQ